MDEIDPVSYYRNTLKEVHAKTVSNYFETLKTKANINEDENIKTIQYFHKLQKNILDKTQSISRIMLFFWLSVISASIATYYIYTYRTQFEIWFQQFGAYAPALMVTPLLIVLLLEHKNIDSLITLLKQKAQEQEELARQQMAPLNNLFTWNMAFQLAEKSFPIVHFDPFFSQERMLDLQNNFAWDSNNLSDNCSVLFTNSGTLNGYPFILVNTHSQTEGEATYSGSISIRWSTRRQDVNGNWYTSQHQQILTAQVVKAYPKYDINKSIIYGNEKASPLNFSRSPSKYSQENDTFLNNFFKNRAISKLEKKSTQTNQTYTIMANHDFELMFGAENRDNEINFRMMFTPLAQQQMLDILKDKTEGFGDDFIFIKRNMMNFIQAKSFDKTNLNGSPFPFMGNDITIMREYFNQFHNDFMHDFFFSIAPLLAIPLYQERRLNTINYQYGLLSKWQQEALINNSNMHVFTHPDSKTKNIIKTNFISENNGVQHIQVAANGFKIIKRIDYITKIGNDNRSHRIPVPWDDYVPVQKITDILVTLHYSGDHLPEILKEKKIYRQGAMIWALL